MNPQGSTIVNTEQIQSMIDRVNNITACSELQEVAAEVIASLSAEKAAILAQIANLAPMLDLLTIPTTPQALLTWAGKYITTILTPYLKPAITYTAQMTAFLAQIALLTAAIEDAASRIGSCSVDVSVL